MIDPPGSIDLDDALTVDPIAGGGWMLTVHVAATAAVIARDSEHDRLARARGASRYLPRKTIPMLAEVEREVTLSERLDRPALTISALFDAAGQRTEVSVRQNTLPAGTCVRMSYQDVRKCSGSGDTSCIPRWTQRTAWPSSCSPRDQLPEPPPCTTWSTGSP